MYHNANDVITNIHNPGLELVMANKMERIRRDASHIDFPNNQFDSNEYNTELTNYEEEGIAGVDAGLVYTNNNGDIVTFPRTVNPNYTGFRKYLNQKKKVFMVKVVTQIDRNPANNHITNIVFTNNGIGIDISFQNTLRLYGNPDLVAAVMGALVQFNGEIICQGFAFADASCYPSAEHVNGEALDTDYLSTTQNNVDFILALNDFGFNLFRIGNTYHGVSNNIYNNVQLAQGRFIRDSNTKGDGSPNLNSLHSSHLHSTTVTINDGEKTL
jgi:hypothetical protein